MSYRVAVVGGTGNVGREMLQVLSDHAFPASEVVPVASARSAGQEVSYGEDDEWVPIDASVAAWRECR